MALWQWQETCGNRLPLPKKTHAEGLVELHHMLGCQQSQGNFSDTPPKSERFQKRCKIPSKVVGIQYVRGIIANGQSHDRATLIDIINIYPKLKHGINLYRAGCVHVGRIRLKLRGRD